jgi:translation initiation factor IF-3
LKGPSPAKPPQKGSKILRDEDIPHQTIVLVDPSTKSLLPPSTLSSLLAALDRDRYAIQLVDPSNDPPICRILDKKEAYQKAKDKKVKDAERAATQVANAGGEIKEVHLTWGVSEHDLEHKLKKGRELLAKGNRLLVGLSDKKRAVKVSHDVRNQVIKQVEQSLEGHGVLKGRPTNRDGAVWLEFSKPK